MHLKNFSLYESKIKANISLPDTALDVISFFIPIFFLPELLIFSIKKVLHRKYFVSLQSVLI